MTGHEYHERTRRPGHDDRSCPAAPSASLPQSGRTRAGTPPVPARIAGPAARPCAPKGPGPSGWTRPHVLPRAAPIPRGLVSGHGSAPLSTGRLSRVSTGRLPGAGRARQVLVVRPGGAGPLPFRGITSTSTPADSAMSPSSVSADPHTYPGPVIPLRRRSEDDEESPAHGPGPGRYKAEVRHIIGFGASAATSASASPLTSPGSSSPIRRATSSVC